LKQESKVDAIELSVRPGFTVNTGRLLDGMRHQQDASIVLVPPHNLYAHRPSLRGEPGGTAMARQCGYS
jgi:hypothetical protein